ncbi:N(6)-adenine-specific methyltransferase METTL4 isoform X2 [Leptidea sinapis]|nr:N(6)-adenine-specific methyltransferase METTL4 isoform X2 [Leptidea sinapis]
MMLKEIYNDFINIFPSRLKSKVNVTYDLLNTGAVRDLAKTLFEKTVFYHEGLTGGNDSDNALICTINGEEFLIPQRSRFYCGDVKESCTKLGGNSFDILIADPPWWNKYIRRLKNANRNLGYSMMYNEEIASIPVRACLSENCLVVVWCTNAQSNINAVKDIIFPKWGVEYLATWFWLKLTVDLEPICSFSSGSGKQPYERVMIGRIGNVENVPEDLVFASIPSALHSHKPPLLDLLKPYTQAKDPKILELFARYMLPNTTSVGYEPLKWQHISLYEET